MPRPKERTTFWGRVTSQLRLGENGCHEFTGHKDEYGYGRIQMGGGEKRLVRVHRAKWELYYGKIEDNKQVLHKCDNPCCINIHHLFLGDHNINMKDKWLKNRCARLIGSKNGSAKLNESQVSIIKLRLRNGDSAISISKDYGVTDTAIRLIKKGVKWKHVL